jgi:hypothetical protein
MTLSLSWVRRVSHTEELIIASDSRLRFGCAWDCCPKIITLPRNDCAICFAGDTMYAYPIMIQIRNAIEMHPQLRSRALDIQEAKGHFLRIIAKMRKYIHDLPGDTSDPEAPSTVFIFAGYSWANQKFRIWNIKYDVRNNEFIHETPPTIMKTPISVTGDDVPEIRKRIYDKLARKGKSASSGIDMEPFEVLRDKIRESSNSAIGGPPQIIKIYKHMNTMPYGVFWPDHKSKQVTYLGRAILDYEIIPYPIIDPDTLATTTLKISNPQYPRVYESGINKSRTRKA